MGKAAEERIPTARALTAHESMDGDAIVAIHRHGPSATVAKFGTPSVYRDYRHNATAQRAEEAAYVEAYQMEGWGSERGWLYSWEPQPNHTTIS